MTWSLNDLTIPIKPERYAFKRRDSIKFINGAVVLAGITAFLYCASTAHVHGFFGVLDLDSDVLDRNLHQILYHGMTLNIGSLIIVPFGLAICVSIHSVYVIAFSKYIGKGPSFGRKVVVFKKWLGLQTKKETAIEKKYNKRMIHYWMLWIACFVFLISMVIFEFQGRSNAQTLLANIDKNDFGVVKYKHNDSLESLAYLYCGSRNCAGLDIKTREVRYFPQIGHSYRKAQKGNTVRNES